MNPFRFSVGGEGGGGTTDPDFDKVVLLLPLDGAQGSTVFPDLSPMGHSVVAAVGAPFITNEVSVFGDGSLVAGGNNAIKHVSTGTEYKFGTGDFTFEGWWTSTTSTPGEIKCPFSFGEADPFRVLWEGGGLRFQWSGASGQALSAALTFEPGVPYHLACVRSGNNMLMFRSGSLIASGTTTNNLDAANGTTLWIGCNGNGGWRWPGYIDDVRITKGLARYTAPFTPPTSAHPTSA